MLLADHRTLAVVDQVVDARWQSLRAATHHPQVGRRVAQQVGQRLARLLWQALGLVDDQHHVERRLRDLGQPGGDAFQHPSATPLRAACGRNPAGRRRHAPPAPAPAPGASGCPAAAPAARRPPRRAPDARVAIAPAARSCRSRPGPAPGPPGGRAGARRRQQPRAHHQVTRHARRRDLEQQVVRRPGAGQVRRSRHGIQPAVARRPQPGWAIEQCMRDPNAHASCCQNSDPPLRG